MTSDDFNKAVHSDAIAFRRKKVEEIIAKGKDASEMEKYFLKIWVHHYGEEAW